MKHCDHCESLILDCKTQLRAYDLNACRRRPIGRGEQCTLISKVRETGLESRAPEQPASEAAGETLENLGAEWANAPKRYQRDMLRVIFEGIYVDVLAKRVVYVKPYPLFAPLSRMDGMEEKEDGCFYYQEQKLDPRVEGLLQLILEARRVRKPLVSA